MDHYVTRKFVIGSLGEAYALQFTGSLDAFYASLVFQ